MEYPQFVQIIVPKILEDATLEIPPKFVKEHGSDLSKYVCLEVSSRNLCKVELKRSDGRVWLDNGWQTFVENFSIKCGYTLVFRCEGGSFFQVFIFDASGSEIKYPDSSALMNQRVSVDQPQGGTIKQEDSDGDSSVVILDEWPQKTREASVTNSNSSRKGDESLQGKGLAPSITRDGVLQRAMAFQSPNPYFIVIIRPTYLRHVHIPGPARIYFHGRDNKDLYLNGPDGKAWFMKYYIGGPPLSQVRIHSGWGRFVQKYHLRDGDACVFELINSSVMAFNITIFKTTEEEAAMPGRKRHGSAALERAEDLQCSKPSFTVLFKHSAHISHKLCIPIAHAKTYLSDQHEKEVFLHVLGKAWPVNCYLYGASSSSQRATFTRGWKPFAVGNDVQEGDVGVFELISQTPNHYNVTIIHAAESANPN